MVLALIILGESERMTLDFYMGALIILAAVLTYPFFDRRRPERFHHQPLGGADSALDRGFDPIRCLAQRHQIAKVNPFKCALKRLCHSPSLILRDLCAFGK